MRPPLQPILAGLLAAAAGTAAAELVAALTNPAAGPIVAVGGVVIDATPTAVKEFAVRTFGTADKPLLLTGIAVALAAAAATIGVLAARRRRHGLIGVALFAALGTAAALSRPAATGPDCTPTLLGGAVTAVALHLLNRRPPVERAPAGLSTGRPARLLDRRTFLATAALICAGTAAAAGGAVAARRARGSASARDRSAVRLPAPSDPAPPLPAGQEPGFVTANADFYRVDTALTVPRVDLDSWRLRIRGMVERPLTLSFPQLLARPLIERHITLNCVSNEVGGPYIGTARWLGVPLAPLLREAGIAPGADQVVARSVDGMSIGTPLTTVLDVRDVMLAVGMNGEPLPFEHGFPVRMLTPGVYGYAGACKWLTTLEVTTFDAVDAYWVQRGWAPRAPVKTAARIDRPAPLTSPAAGPLPIAGVAWAQGRGIAQVEVQIDDEPWRAAELLPVPSTETWVQWRTTWTATPGLHTIRVRATDRTGAVQPELRSTPFPDGATGWHTISVTVAG
ncbi:molybdopterin-dependent oxidoreductase [Dactylosporangium aurantiacum]|uniref:molybdopterin-dependent oxidoreductase n=1 Tax=Dactylosporangium aurantiacum TaxID=35754 RepID=UPI000A98A0A1|nr:molybdopterin-dependent oxidoreductase [Dactylosporangium aurantiacum]MDG6110019.1 molybdopterin-dependent oxidoreductase [Dactylosporangium aurantiacum]